MKLQAWYNIFLLASVIIINKKGLYELKNDLEP